MKYSPKNSRTNAIVICSALFSSSIFFAIYSIFVDTIFPDILKIMSAGCFMLSAILISRYLAFVYVYHADEYEFKITQNTKKWLCFPRKKRKKHNRCKIKTAMFSNQRCSAFRTYIRCNKRATYNVCFIKILSNTQRFRALFIKKHTKIRKKIVKIAP